MNMRFKNTLSIITGGSRGIGLEISSHLLEKGSEVVILDIKPPDKEILSRHKKLSYVRCDLSSEKEITSFFDDFSLPKDKEIILVNNARYKSLSNMEESFLDWNKSIAVGLTAPFILSKEIFERSRKGGSIINICSIASKLATGESPSYHAAKGGLLALTKYLAVMGGEKNFRVNAILPGLIIQDDHLEKYASGGNEAYRNLSENYQPMGNHGTQSDIANLVTFLCSQDSKYLSGSEISLDGAATIQDQFTLLKKFLKKQ